MPTVRFTVGLMSNLRFQFSVTVRDIHRRKLRHKSGGLMASAEREAITGVWGRSPQRGPGAEPLVRGPEGETP